MRAHEWQMWLTDRHLLHLPCDRAIPVRIRDHNWITGLGLAIEPQRTPAECILICRLNSPTHLGET